MYDKALGARSSDCADAQRSIRRVIRSCKGGEVDMREGEPQGDGAVALGILPSNRSAAGRQGRVVPRVRDSMDTRHEQGGSRAGVRPLLPEPEPFPTEVLGCGERRRATPI